MLRRLLSVVVFAALAVVGSQASPITVYFTGTCTDCTGFGANGTVNASITFASAYFYNIVGPAESTNLAYGDSDGNGGFTGVDSQNSSIASFVYDGSNKQPRISTTLPFETEVVFGWNGQNPFPGPQSVTLRWGNPQGINYEFSTVLNSLSSSGDWSFSVANNGPGRVIEDQGTNAVWSFTAPPPSTVPEPATWGMMSGGLGLLGILGAAGKLRG